ncbi:MAG TPA: glycogen-binding domain-containing protein [Gemmatimonadales bacterium]|nr:glycogen-binding domain-containing protein [Gemmatimonadales bacterium]
MMDPRVQQVLDGELPVTALPPELADEVARLEGAAALLAVAPAADARLEARVMAAIRRRAPGPVLRVLQWLSAPRSVTLRFRPVWSLAVVAVFAAVALFPADEPGPVLAADEGVAQFVARFPGARSVDVAGSFNDWRAGEVHLRDDDHDGVWRAAVVLPAGEHEYMFIVDGERWVADPLAGRYVADGFGRENSLIFVRPLAP